MSNPSVGVIGLGSMGFGMARNIMGAGLTVKGYDVFKDACDAFRDAGGEVAGSVAEVTEGVDVLLLMVVDAAQIKEALLNAGAAAVATPGTVCMICSTIAPSDVRDISRQLAELDLLVLDAPVSGGKVGAEAGNLTVMASGPPEAFEKSRPVLDAISGNLYEVGDEPGLGATYKVVHQLAAGTHLAAAAEVMAFGARAGCDTSVLFDILSQSAGSSWMMKDRVPHMLDDDFQPRSAVDIFVKDLGLVLEVGEESKMSLPLAAAAHELFRSASEMGHGRIDDAAVVKVYETLTGSPVKRGG